MIDFAPGEKLRVGSKLEKRPAADRSIAGFGLGLSVGVYGRGRSMNKGSCLCGAVHFEVRGPLGPPDACHCTQCRKQSGQGIMYGAAITVLWMRRART